MNPVLLETTSNFDSSLISEIISLINDVIAIFMTEPVVWFVYLALMGAVIGIVRRIIRPRTR